MASMRVAVLMAVGIATLDAGCARPRPTVTPPPPPPLEVPVVPPRVLAPVDVEPEEVVPAESEPVTQVPRRSRPRPRTEDAGQRPQDAGTTEPARPDQGTPEQAGEAKPSAPKAPALPTAANNEAEARRVGETIDRARSELGRVNVQRLGSDARTQYETARRFVDQALDAIKARNYLFARYLADKAEALARGLQGR
jgi:hypothetical protein